MRFSCYLPLLATSLLLVQSTAAQPDTPFANVGKKIPNLTFKDAGRQPLKLYDLKDKKAIVLVFLSSDCPVSNSYAQPLADIHKEFRKYGVEIIGLTTNQEQTPAEIARFVKEYSLPFPVYLDRDLAVADAVAAQITPEVFVLDGSFTLRYRGRIDDTYYERLKKNHQVKAHELRQVLGELMSGRPVQTASTKAVGCTIFRPEKEVPRVGSVTYHRDVLPILQHHCQSCHRPGEVGPFSLMTYRQAVNWAADIKEYTQNRQMPPWKPVAGMPFHNERRLSPRDLAVLAAWVDGGTPEGDPKTAPAPRQFPQGWQLGTPDVVLTVPDDFQLGPTGRDVFRCFVLPTNLPKDTYVTAVEVRPGNPRVVHHALLFVDTTGQGRKLEQKAQARKAPADGHGEPSLDKGPGYSVNMGVGFIPQGGLSGWAPGQMPRHLPDGFGYPLPRGADVVVQVHYHRNGRLEKDQTRVGLYLAKKADVQPYQGAVIAGGSGTGPFRRFFVIPAKAEAFKLNGSMVATDNCTLYSVMPHMHMLGKEIKVTMTPPNGPAQTLVAIKQWDYNWQETYFFKEPVRIKTGTRLDVEAVYDNSENNPRNPYNPPRPVTFGEQTTNEMCFIFLGGTSDRRGRRLPLNAADPKKADTTAPASK